MTKSPICFFAGANTPEGFTGYMPQCYSPYEGWRVYILKAGAGTGKSTFMRRILQRILEADDTAEAEELYCSSDPDSLDGILFPTHKIAVFDGTAPHVLEPRYWGVCETVVDIGGCADTAVLQKRAADIICATDACGAQHTRCRTYLKAAAALLNHSRRSALPFTDTEKICRTAERIAAREFCKEGNGSEQNRFLSAITPEGGMMLYSTLQALCSRLYVIDDEYGAAGALMLERLRALALAAGEQMITCRCPLSPNDKIEHLIFPRTGVGFTLSNSFHRADFPTYRRIHASRFTDEEGLRTLRQRLAFQKRAARELILEAAEASREAKKIHDELENYSRDAMDFSKVDRLCEEVLKEILTRVKSFEKS